MDSVLLPSGPTSRRLLRELLRPLGDSAAWDRLAARVRPTWSVNTVRARVVDRVEESADTVSLWLQPNRRWTGHRAGQHVMVGVEIDGVRRRRVFSLSSAPQQLPRQSFGRLSRPSSRQASKLSPRQASRQSSRQSSRTIRITLQRQAPGGVTDWLHAHARIGDVVELGSASGQFALPGSVERSPDEPLLTPAVPLLMIAGGTGITPLLAMLQALADVGSGADVVLVQLFRREDDRLFADELATLADRLPGLSIVTHASARQGRLSAETMASKIPDLDQRMTLLCGPAGLMTEVTAEWNRRGLADRLAMERFAAPSPAPDAGGRASVFAARTERVFSQDSGQTLLEAAETAGLEPKSGCRAGICRSCLCHKVRGRTRNLVTGQVSAEPDQWIQLCISVAETDLELSL